MRGEIMKQEQLTMLAVGDISLGMPKAEFFFELVAPTVRQADVVVGQVEHVFTSRPIKTRIDTTAPPADPANMKALSFTGLTVGTLASNHVWDSGPPGIEDTVAGLHSLGIATLGAGMNIDEARRPVVVEKKGTRIGFLDYNCVGPKETWAGRDKAGCAYVHIITYYELDNPSPGGPPTIYTFPDPKSLAAMVEDVKRLRPSCDVLVVSLHKGIGHTPITIATAEQDISRAAIDAGADLILGHHAHILKGIEVYKGKVIFHGLCNFVTAVRHLTDDPSKGSGDWARRRKELFHFSPDPEYPTYPFHPEARYTIIAKVLLEGGAIADVRYIPCLMNKQGQPEILRADERGREVFDYVQRISQSARLSSRFEWEGDEVKILE
jgi:hypothetical protein